MNFVTVYKYVYLSAASLNLVVLLVKDFGEGIPVETVHYITNIGMVVANVVSWIGFRRGLNWGWIAEQILSLGRMAMLVCGATVAPIAIVMGLSAVSFTFWVPLVRASVEIGLWLLWSGVSVALGAEAIYFRRVRAFRAHGDARAAIGN